LGGLISVCAWGTIGVLGRSRRAVTPDGFLKHLEGANGQREAGWRTFTEGEGAGGNWCDSPNAAGRPETAREVTGPERARHGGLLWSTAVRSVESPQCQPLSSHRG